MSMSVLSKFRCSFFGTTTLVVAAEAAAARPFFTVVVVVIASPFCCGVCPFDSVVVVVVVVDVNPLPSPAVFQRGKVGAKKIVFR